MTPETVRDLPLAFVCPLTRRVFSDPVIAPDGYTYERAALDRWQAAHGDRMSPKTLQDMRPAAPQPNAVLQRTMREFFEQQAPATPTALRGGWKENLNCPIGLDVMKQPVRLSSGLAYDLDAIATWLRSSETCPVSKRPVTNVELHAARCDPAGFLPDRTMQALARETAGLVPCLALAYPAPLPAPLPQTAVGLFDMARPLAGALLNLVTHELEHLTFDIALDAARRPSEALHERGAMTVRIMHHEATRQFVALVGDLERSMSLPRAIARRALLDVRLWGQGDPVVDAAEEALMRLATAQGVARRTARPLTDALDLGAASALISHARELVRADLRQLPLPIAWGCIGGACLPALMQPTGYAQLAGLYVGAFGVATLFYTLALVSNRLRIPQLRLAAPGTYDFTVGTWLQRAPKLRLLARLGIQATVSGITAGLLFQTATHWWGAQSRVPALCSSIAAITTVLQFNN